jgi:hypothetical protein
MILSLPSPRLLSTVAAEAQRCISSSSTIRPLRVSCAIEAIQLAWTQEGWTELGKCGGKPLSAVRPMRIFDSAWQFYMTINLPVRGGGGAGGGRGEKSSNPLFA